MDVFTREQRSKLMARIRGKDTRPEMHVRQLVYSMGYRYRLQARNLPGAPDMVFPGRKKVIFVHGCFWHGHDCPKGTTLPKTNENFWLPKLARNKERDAENYKKLWDMGWQILVIWQCQMKDEEKLRQEIRGFLGEEGNRNSTEG